ncbi:MAG: protease inhibitor I42 family protein [Anaerolineales bacterium]|nr:MAG: protease inhibitor I42 family protein [Anaerolineales bacterium]
MKNILLLLISILALSACTSGGSDIFKISDPAKQLEAASGNEFKIIIAANVTTGYHWELVEELDESIVEFVSREYRPDQPITTGSGGVDVWTFKAVSAGETTITLGYYPPSSGEEPEQTAVFSLTVK